MTDIQNIEALGIDFRPCYLLQDEPAEIVVLYLPWYLHLLFADEGQQQLSAKALTQRIDALVEQEQSGLMGQDDGEVLREVFHQVAVYTQLQSIGRSIVMLMEIHYGCHFLATLQL